jgi:hypothetical protein
LMARLPAFAILLFLALAMVRLSGVVSS